jgi:hypothetical protein
MVSITIPADYAWVLLVAASMTVQCLIQVMPPFVCLSVGCWAIAWLVGLSDYLIVVVVSYSSSSQGFAIGGQRKKMFSKVTQRAMSPNASLQCNRDSILKWLVG